MQSLVVFLALASVACGSYLPLAQPPHHPAVIRSDAKEKVIILAVGQYWRSPGVSIVSSKMDGSRCSVVERSGRGVVERSGRGVVGDDGSDESGAGIFKN
ncbi:unnamed protein product [Leptidea sinapis]|uniref:Uncharacterized protein n=1 Tax=Leptidea sinapis TaxID=189913 RepID=A0A5E4R9H8_9NEOP|nr:unnamed protein product [Leptidea sinapis]